MHTYIYTHVYIYIYIYVYIEPGQVVARPVAGAELADPDLRGGEPATLGARRMHTIFLKDFVFLVFSLFVSGGCIQYNTILYDII